MVLPEHAWQAVDAGEAEKVPAEQVLHSDKLLRPTVVLYVPFGQGAHDLEVALAAKPAGQFDVL